MQKQELERLTKNVIEIAREAGDYILANRKQKKLVVEKGVSDYATNLDIESERIISARLEDLDPKYFIYGEEEHSRPDADKYWMIDPIDGTRNFFRGLPLWAVNISLFNSETRKAEIGVIYFPELGHMFSAFVGGGAYLNSERIEPSSINDPKESVVLVENPNRTTGHLELERYIEVVKNFFRIRSWGVGAALCYVASGSFEAFFDFTGTTKDYDILGGILIANEAGCKVIEFDYEKQVNKRVVIVTNGKLNLS